MFFKKEKTVASKSWFIIKVPIIPIARYRVPTKSADKNNLRQGGARNFWLKFYIICSKENFQFKETISHGLF